MPDARDGVTVDVDAAATTFFGCFGFFCSRLLRNWPLAMAVLLRGCVGQRPASIRFYDWENIRSFALNHRVREFTAILDKKIGKIAKMPDGIRLSDATIVLVVNNR